MGLTFARKLKPEDSIGNTYGDSPPSLVAEYGGDKWIIHGVIYTNQAEVRYFISQCGFIFGRSGYTHIAECDVPCGNAHLRIRKIFNLEFEEVINEQP